MKNSLGDTTSEVRECLAALDDFRNWLSGEAA